MNSLRSNIRKWLFLGIVIFLPFLSFARIGLYESSHNLSIGLGAGYTSFLENYKEATTLGGAGSIMGVGYEYRRGGFWFGVNADLQLYNSMLKNKLDTLHVQMNDTEGDLATFYYKMNKWNDKQSALYISVPLMLGYYSYSGFYFGAGLKYGFPLKSKFTSKLDYKTTEKIDKYIGEFEEMPNHLLTDHTSLSDVMRKKSNKFIQNLSLCFEIGGEVYNNQFYHYGAHTLILLKMALCIEYGVNNLIYNNIEHNILSFNEVNPIILDIKPFYDCKITTNQIVRSLFVGLKFTLLLTPKSCRTCPF